MGGIRGVFYFNMAARRSTTSRSRSGRASDEVVTPDHLRPARGTRWSSNPGSVTGFRLRDGRASYGIGLETFALGFPIHFDWSWRTLFNRQWEDVVYAGYGGGEEFRKPQFSVWVGYDF